MREIKFRGKEIETGQWIYGFLEDVNEPYKYAQIDTEDSAYIVNLTTVGQYTGLKDKNGKEIYEGDIVHYHEEYTLIPDNGKLADAKFTVVDWVGEIIFWSGAFAMHFTDEQNRESYMIIGLQKNAQIKVVGNIHEPVAQCCEYMCTARASGLCKGEDYGRCLNKGQLDYNVTKKLIELINKKQQL